MSFIIAHHGTSQATLQRNFGEVRIIDVTSHAADPWVRFSPFYPHGNIPIPFSPGHFGASVEGIWQGLKVFQFMDIDASKFAITNMKGLKRSAKKYGQVLGHRAGIEGDELLSYRDARYALYLPTYLWTLEHCLQDELALLREMEKEQTVVLLDYETNCDLQDLRKPLSHAGLVKRYLEGSWSPRFST